MKIPVEKNKEYVVDIIDYGTDGEGIAKIDGYTIFIPGAMKDEKCKILIVKVLTSHAFGKLINIIEKSQKRQEKDCTTFPRCGGCDLRHINYEETLKIKKEKVENLLNKSGLKNIKVKDTIGMKNPYNYRNKAIYPIEKKNDKVSFGIYAKRSHDVIEIKKCKIQTLISQNIAEKIVEFLQEYSISIYNEKEKTGLIKNIMIREGFKTGQIMCVIVCNSKDLPYEDKLVDTLVNKFPEITTIIKNINDKDTNVVLGKENVVLYGQGYIVDKLGEYEFKISPNSFYQINPIQTEKLYKLALKVADLKENESILDLYCGIGTIGIFASSKANEVLGIEIVEDAIKNAIENAKLNNISNIRFICGDVEEEFNKMIKNNVEKPSVVFIDPPRKGMDDKTVQNLLELKPDKIVYISCNPATFVRDLKKLNEKYDIGDIQPLDMFPFTRTRRMCGSATTKTRHIILDFDMVSEIITFEKKADFWKKTLKFWCES